MSPLVLGLVIASTFFHAGWNLLARRSGTEVRFFRRSLLLVSALGLLPFAVATLAGLRLPALAFGLVVASGTCCGIYYLGLARAYESGDFTVVYPVARALPVLLVGLFDFARGRHPTAAGWVGMALVAVGCLGAPLTSLREVRWRRYVNRNTAWIVLTALGTVGYSMLDKLAQEAVPPGPATAAAYCYLFFVVSTAAYYVALGVVRGERNETAPPWRLVVPAALFNFGSYFLVLWVFQMVGRAGYVVALRQFSIVIGVAAAILWFHEPGARVRLSAALVICAGMALITLAG